MARFRPITERVIDPASGTAAEAIEQFIGKLWEATDLGYLRPITEVLRIDPGRAAEVYHAWKGVTYYEYQYKRTQRALLDFADWLQRRAPPADFVKAARPHNLDTSSTELAAAFARPLSNASATLRPSDKRP